ncbi:MAG: ABC transporter permease [Candidatus Omnitrophica bacterium]|nr:ABC transporter permease [Candidatus Omnitrophota bacterium]
MKKSNSGFRRGIRKLKQHKLAVFSFWLLLVLYLSAFFAPILSPYHYKTEKRAFSYAPPSKVYIVDKEGKLSWPFIYRRNYQFNEFYKKVYQEDKTKEYPIKLFVKGDSYKFLGVLKTDIHLFGVDDPAYFNLLGTDSRGRDLFSRIVYGGQISLSIGLVGVSIALIIGVLVGGLSGYFGGKTDTLLMRFAEIIMVIPSFYLMLSLRSVFSYSLSSLQIYFIVVFIMSFIGWPGIARVVRGMAISIRQREFVLASRALGGSHLGIIKKHIIPHTFSYIIVAASISIPGYILGESALSLLGLGIQDPYASWGNLLSEAMAISQIQLHPWVLIPGIFIFITVMAFNLLGDGLRDAFDPHAEFIKK